MELKESQRTPQVVCACLFLGGEGFLFSHTRTYTQMYTYILIYRNVYAYADIVIFTLH